MEWVRYTMAKVIHYRKRYANKLKDHVRCQTALEIAFSYL